MSEAKPVVLTEERLPPRLRDLPRPPAALFVRGELPRGPAVAIVGTRHPTPEGVAFARNLAAEFARAGVAVLSGGAKGIDAAAHEGALAVRGCTVVVAPAGFGAPFPSEHASLFERVLASGGAYVALVPDDRPAHQSAFFARNRCLVALSQALVVVQAPFRSGARNAAKHARVLGRPLFVVPSSPWIAEGRGCIEELRLGAEPCGGSREVLKRLRSLGAVAVPSQEEEPASAAPHQQSLDFSELPEGERDAARLAEAIGRCGVDPDALGVALELPAARIQRGILTLRLQGVLVPGPRGTLILSK